MPDKKKYLDFINSNNGFDADELVIRKNTKITDLDFETMVKLFEFRNWDEINTAGIKMMVTSAYRPGDDGAHGEGKAFDIILFNKWKEQVIRAKHLWLLATTFPWRGVGIYFDWHFVNNDGEKIPCVGIHVDNSTSGRRPLRWLRITKVIDGEPTRLYYYQNTSNGLFYNLKLMEVMELDDAINRVWPK